MNKNDDNNYLKNEYDDYVKGLNPIYKILWVIFAITVIPILNLYSEYKWTFYTKPKLMAEIDKLKKEGKINEGV